jgi:hypothetical protein
LSGVSWSQTPVVNLPQPDSEGWIKLFRGSNTSDFYSFMALTKVQEDDTAQSQGFPRSIECQGDPNQGIGQIWALGSIGNQNGGTWITFRGRKIDHPASWANGPTDSAGQFDPAAPEMDFGGLGDPTNNLIVGRPGYGQPRPAAI